MTLHRCDADGSNIEQLSQSPVSEFSPVVLDDGRIMYHRWEYVDKGSLPPKAIYTMNPDGTKPMELYGLDDGTMKCYVVPRPMPGKDNRIVWVISQVLTACMPVTI
jgi:hypothetical protein